MRGKWVLLAVTAVLVAVAAGALSVLRHRSTQTAAAAPKAVEPSTPTGEISLPGTVHAQHVVSVSPEISGTIAAFGADVGQEVYEGQVLARLTNQGLESEKETAATAVEIMQERINKLESAVIAARLEASRARADAQRSRADYDSTSKTYTRQKTLHAEGATPRLAYERSEREFETAKGEFEGLDAVARQSEERIAGLLSELQNAKNVLEDKNKQLEQATADLGAGEVLSPVTGLIVARRGEAGSEHQQNTELFEIATDLALLEVLIDPEPPVLKQLKVGQPAMVFNADVRGEGMPGRVKEVRDNGAVVEFTSPTPLIKPGMTAQVRLKM